MNTSDIVSYAMTLTAISLAPGPVLLMLLVRAMSNDAAGAIGFSLGSALGDLIIITAVTFGLATWLTAAPEMVEYSKYPLMGYILFLARGIWKGGISFEEGSKSKAKGVLSSFGCGMAATFMSPYMLILLPLSVTEMTGGTTVDTQDFLIIAGTTFVSFFACDVVMVTFAARLSRLMRSPKNVLILNRSLACLLVGGGACMSFC